MTGSEEASIIAVFGARHEGDGAGTVAGGNRKEWMNLRVLSERELTEFPERLHMGDEGKNE